MTHLAHVLRKVGPRQLLTHLLTLLTHCTHSRTLLADLLCPYSLTQCTQGSFDPFEDETSRIAACAAVVAALQHPSPLEFSVSSAKAEASPTSGQWEAMLNAL